MKRHYHWIIAGSALFTLFVTNGIAIGGLSVFDESQRQTFGWSRGALKFRDLLTLRRSPGSSGCLRERWPTASACAR